jgi:hypothetical protein
MKFSELSRLNKIVYGILIALACVAIIALIIAMIGYIIEYIYEKDLSEWKYYDYERSSGGQASARNTKSAGKENKNNENDQYPAFVPKPTIWP